MKWRCLICGMEYKSKNKLHTHICKMHTSISIEKKYRNVRIRSPLRGVHYERIL